MTAGAAHRPAHSAAQTLLQAFVQHLAAGKTDAALRAASDARAELDMAAALGPVPPEVAPLWHWRHVLPADMRWLWDA